MECSRGEPGGLAAIVLPATPAAAATCTLSIERLVGPEFYNVTVGCTGVQEVFGIKLYGSDGWPNPDDYLTSNRVDGYFGCVIDVAC